MRTPSPSSRDHAFGQLASGLGAESDEHLDDLRARLAELPAEEWTGAAIGNGNRGTQTRTHQSQSQS